MKDRTQDWIGRGVVAAVMAMGIVLTGCDVPDGVKRDRAENPRLPQQREVTVQPAAVVTESPAVASARVEPVISGPVRYETAESAWRDGRYGDAVVLFTRYTEDRPGNPWGHYMLGLAARRTGDLATAERAFETALTADPDHVKSLLNLSRTLLDADRPGDALTKAERAVELDPGSSDAYRLRGLAYAGLGQEFDAIESYRQAILLDPADAWSANNLGLLHIRAGRFDEAVGPLAQAITVQPDVTVFRNNLGVALEHIGAWGQASAQYGVAADGGHQRATASQVRILPLIGEGEPVVDLDERAREFIESLTMGDATGSFVPIDTIAVVPGESRQMTLLWDDVLRRYGAR